ncbi:membrane protein [Arthrobacter phage Lewando]|nr:membrane protein [Arthrobacter phage Lewando]
MEKYTRDDERELNMQLLKSLAIFIGLKAALYIFIAWSARWARKHSQ